MLTGTIVSYVGPCRPLLFIDKILGEGDILLMVREEVNDLGQKPPIHVTVPTEKKNDSTD